MSSNTKTGATGPKMSVFSTSGAMYLLWQKAEKKLLPDELEWLATGAAQQVGLETNALADVLMGLGSMVASDTEAGSFQSGDSVSNLLFNLSNQVSTINALSKIAEDAGYNVRQALKGKQGGENG